MRLSGVNYSAGVLLNDGNQGAGGSVDAIWQLDGKYDSLEVRIGLDDYSQPLFARLDIYLSNTEEGLYGDDVTPFQSIQLSPWDVSRVHTINFYGAYYARFSLTKTTWNNWATASYCLVEGVWIPNGDYSVTYNTYAYKDPFETSDFNDWSFMNICPVIRSVNATFYDNCHNLGKTFTFKDTGTTCDNGFVLSSYAVSNYGNGKALFNTDGRFSNLTMDVGFVNRLKNTQFHVYLDNEEEPSMSFDVTDGVVSTVTIPLYGASSVRIQIDNHNDGWATDAIGFGNITWN